MPKVSRKKGALSAASLLAGGHRVDGRRVPHLARPPAAYRAWLAPGGGCCVAVQPEADAGGIQVGLDGEHSAGGGRTGDDAGTGSWFWKGGSVIYMCSCGLPRVALGGVQEPTRVPNHPLQATVGIRPAGPAAQACRCSQPGAAREERGFRSLAQLSLHVSLHSLEHGRVEAGGGVLQELGLAAHDFGALVGQPGVLLQGREGKPQGRSRYRRVTGGPLHVVPAQRLRCRRKCGSRAPRRSDSNSDKWRRVVLLGRLQRTRARHAAVTTHVGTWCCLPLT